MLALPLERRYVLGPIGVSALLFLIYVVPDAWRFQLTFERDLIEAGEYWRILTGQLVHLDISHLVLNILGVWVMFLLFAEHAPRWHYVAVVTLLALFSNLGMLWFAPEIDRYVGFSGVLYGLFAWGALLDVYKKVRFGWILLIGVLLKVTWEYIAGPVALGAASTANLATAAHFFGMVGGLFVAGWQVSRSRIRRSDKSVTLD
ncbi:rhombosortase [Aliidiomarina sanyensis]|uniref:Rhombosortase n=1 Tax=Aliidiomarina sanyensis TaxID=1249555 RepID=A0A432WN87_9GAMM|nr:rhombosortase [Aliidiomarina sanyensis]RUO35245.1 rhombosortase [Aliidiomarina sanyensis]